MSLSVTDLIYRYLDNNYPIDGDSIDVGMDDISDLVFQYQRLTTIDVEISEIFGVELYDYFWGWTYKRIGPTITIILKHGDMTFTDGVEHKYSKPEILKGIQQTKINNKGRWTPIQ